MITEAERIERSNDQLAAIVRGFHEQIKKAQIELTSQQELERQVRFLQARRSEAEDRLGVIEATTEGLRKRVVQLEEGPEWLKPLQSQIQEVFDRVVQLENVAGNLQQRMHQVDQLTVPAEMVQPQDVSAKPTTERQLLTDDRLDKVENDSRRTWARIDIVDKSTEEAHKAIDRLMENMRESETTLETLAGRVKETEVDIATTRTMLSLAEDETTSVANRVHDLEGRANE